MVLVRRKYGGRIEEVKRILPARSRTRGAVTWHGTNARLNHARWQISIAHQAGVAGFVLLIPVPLEKLRHFFLNGLRQQRARPFA